MAADPPAQDFSNIPPDQPKGLHAKGVRVHAPLYGGKMEGHILELPPHTSLRLSSPASPYGEAAALAPWKTST